MGIKQSKNEAYNLFVLLLTQFDSLLKDFVCMLYHLSP